MFDKAFLTALAMFCHDSGEYTQACNKASEATYMSVGFQQKLQNTDDMLKHWAEKQDVVNNKITATTLAVAKIAHDKKVEYGLNPHMLDMDRINFSIARYTYSINLIWRF